MTLFRLFIAIIVGIAVWTLKVSLFIKAVLWFGITMIIYIVLNIINGIAYMLTREVA